MSSVKEDSVVVSFYNDNDDGDDKKNKTRRKKRPVINMTYGKNVPRDEIDFVKKDITTLDKQFSQIENKMEKIDLNILSKSECSSENVYPSSVLRVCTPSKKVVNRKDVSKSEKIVNKKTITPNKVSVNSSCKCTCDLNKNEQLDSIPNIKTTIFYNSSLNSVPVNDTDPNQCNITPKTVKNKQKCLVHNKKLSNSLKKQDVQFDQYLPEPVVIAGLKYGTLIEGSIRINPKNFKECYITNPDNTEQDFLIESVKDRNRALEGDIVVIQVKPQTEWRRDGQKTAKVVFIKEKVHQRTCVGTLKLMPDKNNKFALLSPLDSRVPRLKIPFVEWPELFYQESEKYEKTLFLASIVDWEDVNFALGKIIDNIGMSGDLKTETSVILLENGLNVTPYALELNDSFKKIKEIPIEELQYREDLRDQCVFTIDPLTAKDLDDAVSCRELANGNLEIGVHISDVSFYLKEDDPIDEIASQKATSVYLVEKVYHMLPQDLCMLCSLLPGEDKLAFSVIWEMTKDGVVLNHRFTRSIINSCTQLAYDHAQLLLENPDKEFSSDNFPKIYHNYSIKDLQCIINFLYKISFNLRSKRFESGALRIDQPKVVFRIDPNTGMPLEYSIYENRESHRLIEEFMLLANITVATKLFTDFPDIAFLRSHPPPHQRLMTNLRETLEKIGIHFDVSSAGSLQRSMCKYSGDDELSKARMMVLNLLCAKPMARAKYFCIGAPSIGADDFDHYALNVPLYTHFTSPIRRYADIMVHRLLAASLQYEKVPTWNIDHVESIAGICNKQKYNAKKAGEQSIDFYLMKYIEKNQPIIETGVVLDVKDYSFDVIIVSMGINVRIYANKLSPAIFIGFDKKVSNVASMTICWPANAESKEIIKVIDIFSLVKVELKVPASKKIEAILIKPDK